MSDFCFYSSSLLAVISALAMWSTACQLRRARDREEDLLKMVARLQNHLVSKDLTSYMALEDHAKKLAVNGCDAPQVSPDAIRDLVNQGINERFTPADGLMMP